MATLLIKGQVRGNAEWLGSHLSSAENNEQISVIGSVGIANSTDIRAAMHELRAMHGNDKRCFFHAKINISTDKCDELKPNDWQQIAAHHARRLGLENNARMLVLHKKNGRTHLHIAYCTRSLSGKLWRDSNVFQRNLGIQFAIAKEDMPHLGLSGQEPGKASKPDGPRPQPRRKTDADFARESGRGARIDADRVAADASAAWKAAQAEPAARRGLRLVEELARRGYAVVEGRRGPGIVHRDEPSVFHSLARRAGQRVGEVRAVLSGIELPAFDEATKVRANDLRKRQGVDAAQRGLQQDRTRQRRTGRVATIEGALPSASPYPPPPGDKRRNHARNRWIAETSLQQAQTTVFHAAEFLSSPVYLGRDGIHRARLLTGETLRIEADRISVHTRPAPSASSPEAARAVVAAGLDKGWTCVHLNGPDAFRTEAAREAARRGIQVADADLREIWTQERERIEIEQRQQAAAAHVHDVQAAISATRQRATQAGKFLSHYDVKPSETVTMFTAQAAVRADLIQQYGPDLSQVPDSEFDRRIPTMSQRLRAAQAVVRDAPEAQRAQIADAWTAYDNFFASRRGKTLRELHDDEVARATGGPRPSLESSDPRDVHEWLTKQRSAKASFVASIAAECNATGVPIPALPDAYKPSAQAPDLAALTRAKADIERQRQRQQRETAEKASKPKAWMPEPPKPPGM